MTKLDKIITIFFFVLFCMLCYISENLNWSYKELTNATIILFCFYVYCMFKEENNK